MNDVLRGLCLEEAEAFLVREQLAGNDSKLGRACADKHSLFAATGLESARSVDTPELDTFVISLVSPPVASMSASTENVSRGSTFCTR